MADVALILIRTEGVIKHLLLDARRDMTAIFDGRCALVSKRGVCHQCSKLNGLFNPKQNQRQEVQKLRLRKAEGKYDAAALF